MKTRKKWLMVIPIVCGILVLVLLRMVKQAPKRMDEHERTRAVRIIGASPMTVVPRARGYGYVEPSRTWEAIAEVSGRIVEIHPELKSGMFIKAGEVLMRIDPSAYGLAETRGQADVSSVDAQLKELDQSKINTERLLAVEKRSLELSSRELERMRDLYQQGYISKSDLEREEKQFLAQQSAVNNLQNTLDLIPAQRKALLARKTTGVTTVSERRLDLAKTEIRAPFDCRIAAVNVEPDQYAVLGSTLVRAVGIASVEIPVQLSPGTFMNLLPKLDTPLALGEMGMDQIRRAIGISALVRLPLFEREPAVWQGRFSRTSESIDPATGAITVFITVDEPYADVGPGKRPPLVKNLYCEVTLFGRPRTGRYAIPRSALHQGQVYLAGPDDRLRFKTVTVAMYVGDLAVIADGLRKGDRIVISDVVPAIQGLLLKPVLDTAAMARIQKTAQGA